MKSPWAIRTGLFIQATLYTGLRPCEWADAEFLISLTFNDGEVLHDVLRVRNAKNTNQRSHGEYRHILLTDLSFEQKDLIAKHLLALKSSTNSSGVLITPSQYYERCRKLLYRIIKNLYPASKKHPSIYSCRHQFCADLKKAGYSRIEIAALMGHAVDDTAESHYGKKRVGSKRGGLAKPYQPEVDRIRCKSTTNHMPRLK